MTIRRAKGHDIPRVTALLSQVLEIHAAARPDVFVAGTTKHSPAELEAIFADENTPVYVAVDEADSVIGYAFCAIKPMPDKVYFVPATSLYIDDLCVDEASRKCGVGEALFRFVCGEASRLGCSSVTLNVWEKNGAARRFYEKMGMTPRSTTMELKV